MKEKQCLSLVWGPKDSNDSTLEMHMYFAPHAIYYRNVCLKIQHRESPIYPKPLEIPFGTILKFERLSVGWQSNYRDGCIDTMYADRISFVIYTKQADDTIGLLLPEVKKTLKFTLSETEAEEITENHPLIFLPFPNKTKHGSQVNSGLCEIISYPK